MSTLKREYELSVWADDYSNSGFTERKVAVIGSDKMTSLCRAISPTLVNNVNGSNTLNFSMYYSYIDTITGERVENPFCNYLLNESKLKLHYKNKWYDFIIKSVSKDSSQYKYAYSATDLHINELSKNGYNVVFNSDLNNNSGTAKELLDTALKDTEWSVTMEANPQMVKDHLVEFQVSGDISAYQITDSSMERTQKTISSGSRIYVFYSDIIGKEKNLQFLYKSGGFSASDADDNRILSVADTHYLATTTGYAENSAAANYGLTVPTLSSGSLAFSGISQAYMGERYVFSPKTLFDPILNRYVTKYLDGATTLYGFTETKTTAPVVIRNYVSNSSNFKSTAGWTGAAFASQSPSPSGASNIKATIKPVALDSNNVDVIELLMNGTYTGSDTLTAGLKIEMPAKSSGIKSGVINSGFYDQRASLQEENFTNGVQWVVYFKSNNNSSLRFAVVIEDNNFKYYPESSSYSLWSSSKIIDFSTAPQGGTNGYSYIVANVGKSLSQKELRNSKMSIIMYSSSDSKCDIILNDLQIFPYVDNGNEGFLIPTDQNPQAITQVLYKYYNPELTVNKNATSESEYVYAYVLDETQNALKGLTTQYNTDACQIHSIEIKESNYFNIISKVCETFQYWINFNVGHDAYGAITSKAIELKRYVGKENYSGFKYGVNLKQISRNLDSKSIVTKLYVKNNSNEFGKNGFCSIARAKANESGENVIYNFDYYINQKLLDAASLENILYKVADGSGPDVADAKLWNKSLSPGYTNNCNGFYPRLALINKELDTISEQLTQYSILLTQTKAKCETNQAGLDSAVGALEEAEETFKQAAGFAYTEINTTDVDHRKHIAENNSAAHKALEQIATYLTQIKIYTSGLSQAQTAFEQYEELFSSLEERYTELTSYKEELNIAFFKLFNRFIQEGTWISESYYNDEEYYLDSLSTLYNSNLPKVSYTIGVLELSQLDEYKYYDFALGDRTFVEDPEFFGYAVGTNNPLREDVVVTEISSNLDNPEQNTIKVQNYKNQFEDLFHAIIATVQSVQYSAGGYDKAAALATADEAQKVEFLQGALNSAALTLQNMGDQTVVWDNNGITITDSLEPSKQLRLVSGGILLRDKDESGTEKWLTGFTANGLSAKLLTAGQVDTSVIQIMNGSEAYFRWDALGLTAYHFNSVSSSGYINGLDTSKGVRFDRFGIYGFEGLTGTNDLKDGGTWHPADTAEIESNASFYLTWEGLKVTAPAHAYSNTSISDFEARLGKVSNTVYHSWNDGKPSTAGSNSDFVELMRIAPKNFNENSSYFRVFSDGTLMANRALISGNIEAKKIEIKDTNSNTIFKADGLIGNPEVKIGGLDVNTSALTNGTIGSDKSFYLSTADLVESKTIAGNTTNAWRLTVGSNFGVTSEGNIYATGGKIGGFDITSTSLTNGIVGSDNSLRISTQPFDANVGGASGTIWRMVIGPKFGVTYTGKIYATGVDIAGELDVQANSKIAGWSVTSNSLTKGTIGANDSIYLSTANLSSAKTVAGTSLDTWRLTVGSNFGVTQDGSAYLKAGYIGNLRIASDSLVMPYTYEEKTQEFLYLGPPTTIKFSEVCSVPNVVFRINLAVIDYEGRIGYFRNGAMNWLN